MLLQAGWGIGRWGNIFLFEIVVYITYSYRLFFSFMCFDYILFMKGEYMPAIKDFRKLRVYQKAFDVSSKIFELSKGFPQAETYSLIDQIRRSSRSVCANIAEAHRRRIYPKS